MTERSRRQFLKSGVAAGGVALAGSAPLGALAASKPGSKIKLGLVTYLWAKDWDVPTIIANCQKTGFGAVELRTEHKHGVEPSLSKAERLEVKKRFADSPIVLLGPGTNQNYDSPDAAKLKKSIEGTKAFLQLSKDCGGSGVKVKPNSFHKDVAREKTIEQIGKSLNVVGKFAGDLGQQIRLEVHGSCSPPPIIKQIMDIADNPNVAVCWNCNGQDLDGKGLEHNFNLLKGRFGATAHVREFNVGDYPYQQLMGLFAKMDYDGWISLEARTKPKDKVAALIEQRRVFQTMVAKAQAAL